MFGREMHIWNLRCRTYRDCCQATRERNGPIMNNTSKHSYRSHLVNVIIDIWNRETRLNSDISALKNFDYVRRKIVLRK